MRPTGFDEVGASSRTRRLGGSTFGHACLRVLALTLTLTLTHLWLCGLLLAPERSAQSSECIRAYTRQTDQDSPIRHSWRAAPVANPQHVRFAPWRARRSAFTAPLRTGRSTASNSDGYKLNKMNSNYLESKVWLLKKILKYGTALRHNDVGTAPFYLMPLTARISRAT